MHRLGVLVVAVSLIAGVFAPTSTVAASSSELLELWKSGGHIAVMRHALARNRRSRTFHWRLHDPAQSLRRRPRSARAIGAMLRANGIETASPPASGAVPAHSRPFGSGRTRRQDGVELLLHPP